MGQRFVGALFALIGVGIFIGAPVVSLRCATSGPSALECVAEKKVLGVLAIGRLRLPGVTGASVDVQEAREGDTVYRVERLFLRSGTGETRLPGFSRREGGARRTVLIELAPFDTVATEITDLAKHGGPGVAEYRSFTWTPLLVGAGFLLFGVLALWPSGRARAGRGGTPRGSPSTTTT